MPETAPDSATKAPTIVPTPKVDAEVLRKLGIDDLAAAGAAATLQAALAGRVAERFPGEVVRWPLISQRFLAMPYLAGERVQLPVDERGVPQSTGVPFVYPTGAVLLVIDPLPGNGACVADVFRWVLMGHVPLPENLEAHDALRTMANVAPGGALFVLPADALKARDGAWIKDPAVVRQIEYNLANHRRLLGPDPEAVRKATVRPARVAEVLGIRQNALANGVERAGPDSKYARLAEGRTEGGFTFETVEMTAAEWGVGLQGDMERLARIQALRKEIRAQIVAEATAVMADAHTAPLEREACRKFLEKAGEIVWKDGPRR